MSLEGLKSPYGQKPIVPEINQTPSIPFSLRLLMGSPEWPVEESKDDPSVGCVYFQGGFCRYGAECRFSHFQSESRPPLCKFFKSSRGCHYGDSCRYSHESILCERVKVPESCLGALIGKNGTTRARLEAESRIENITIMTSSSEVVLTARDPAGIQRATRLIMEVVKECELRQQTKQSSRNSSSPSQVGIEVRRRGKNQQRRSLKPIDIGESNQVASSQIPEGGWHQCALCRKSFSSHGALADHQKAKGHLLQVVQSQEFSPINPTKVSSTSVSPSSSSMSLPASPAGLISPSGSSPQSQISNHSSDDDLEHERSNSMSALSAKLVAESPYSGGDNSVFPNPPVRRGLFQDHGGQMGFVFNMSKDWIRDS